LRNLERVLAREEEVKKKAVVHKDTYEGPTIRFFSRDGESRLEFINGASFGSELCTTSAPYPEKSVCVVTGLPAKYVSVTPICAIHSMYLSLFQCLYMFYFYARDNFDRHASFVE